MLIPLHVGGGPDGPEKAYRALRAAEGIGGSAPDESGIDALWRRSQAVGLEAATSGFRRAVNNCFPHLAQDTLPYFERVLGVWNAGAPDAERRETVALLWQAKSSALMADILTELQQIDARFSFLSCPDAYTIVCHDGRSFGALPGATEAPFGLRDCSLAGLYTTRSVLRVRFTPGHAGVLSVSERRAIALARAKLRSVLPSWWDFTITTSTGFLCGDSPLGLTALGGS